MKIDYPTQSQIPALRKLWQDTFEDDDAFLDRFYAIAFAPDRCRCVNVNDELVAALYWFDCRLEDKPIAYVYAVATAEAHRGKGYCRALMENLHSHLTYLGYAGAVLVPATERLFQMYEALGYQACSMASEVTCAAAEQPVSLRAIDAEEFCRLRRQLLPERSVLQEDVSLAFLETMARFYAGDDFLLTVSQNEGKFVAPELLGNVHAAPSILAAFGEKEGVFRTPGGEKPFAMYRAFSNLEAPAYFGFAFD